MGQVKADSEASEMNRKPEAGGAGGIVGHEVARYVGDAARGKKSDVG